MTWLGHAAFEVLLDGVAILIDPWLTGNPKAPKRREEMARCDLILVSHDHEDHGMGDAVEIAKATHAPILSIFEMASYASAQGVESTIGLNVGGTTEFKGLKVTLTPALHSSGRGSPVGFIIRGKKQTIYHAGDTGIFGDMALIGKLYKPTVALLPIGGYYTMGPEEAAYAVGLIKPKVAIPMHYQTFPEIAGDPEGFSKLVKRRRAKVRVVILKPGETFKI